MKFKTGDKVKIKFDDILALDKIYLNHQSLKDKGVNESSIGTVSDDIYNFSNKIESVRVDFPSQVEGSRIYLSDECMISAEESPVKPIKVGDKVKVIANSTQLNSISIYDPSIPGLEGTVIGNPSETKFVVKFPGLEYHYCFNEDFIELVKPKMPKSNLLTPDEIGALFKPKEQMITADSYKTFFTKFIQKVGPLSKSNPPLFDAIVKKVCEGTKHTNLINFSQDNAVSMVYKVQIFTTVLCALEEQDKSGSTNILKVDENAAADKIRKEFDELAEKYNFHLEHEKELNKTITQQLSGILQLKQELEEVKKGNPVILRIVKDATPEEVITEVTELFHKQLPEILETLMCRNAQGFSEFVYLWGAPGSGKTHLGEQIAKGLGVKYYPYPADPTVTAGKLLGFNNIATGTFVQGWLYLPYKEGGLVMIDEGDLMDASCFAGANSIENRRFTFGNNETVERHKDFYLVVSANTRGTGATKGFQRNKLDAATLDRFTMIELHYDEDLEQKIYGNKDWAQYVQRVRGYCAKNFKDTIYITSRAIRKGAAYLKRESLTVDFICNTTIFKLMTKDQKEQVINNVGKFNKTFGKNGQINKQK